MKYLFACLFLIICLSGCKKDETFNEYFGFKSSVLYKANCNTTYFVRYTDESGNTVNNDFLKGASFWKINMAKGSTASLTIQTFGEPGNIEIVVDGIQKVYTTCDSKAEVTINYIIK